MPLRNVATTFTIEQQRLEINNLAGDVNNIATGATTVGTATTATALAAGATGADLTLSGTLTVNGTQTILNTETLQVEDKEIVIGNVSSPTNATANGGGWKLKGADNKTITYSQTGDKWVSNKDFEAPNLIGAVSGVTGSPATVAGNLQFIQGTPELEFNNGGARLTVQAANSLSVHTGGGIGTTTNEVARFTNTGLSITGGAGIGTTPSTGSAQLDVVGAIGGVRAKVTTNNGGYLLYQGLSSGDASVFTVTHNGRVTGEDGIYDSKGNLRSVPANEPGNTNYTLAASDAGKYVDSQGSGTTITVPANTFSQGDVVTILRATSGDCTIAQGSGVTMYHSADGANTTTGNRTLSQRGMATMIFVNANYCYISGAGLS
tara:strand:- start:1516 stop:2646 length:1131 start_codon:yes stop_codon:yes gene_type:complete